MHSEVFPYGCSVWYEKITEDQYQSGGHYNLVILSLALGGGFATVEEAALMTLMRLHANFGKQTFIDSTTL